jgi:hypothetical protein
MFNLTLHDHLQLTFSEIIQRHHAHAVKAQSQARWSRRLRGSEALLVGGVCLTAAAAAYGQGQVLAIVAASFAGLALLILLVDLTFDFEASARAHATCGAHLWGLRERYRALLSDLHDGAINLADARLRRDKLMDELRTIYETTSSMAVAGGILPLPATVVEEAGAPSPPSTSDFSPKDRSTKFERVR